MRRLGLAFLLLPGAAMSADAPTITVSDAWSRATVGPTAPGVAYLTIVDAGPADALTGATTPVAASASLHETHAGGGMIGMSPAASLPIPANGTVKLAPGGYHIMLEGLKQPLKAGDHFALTLTFEHAAAVTTTVTVRPLGAASAKSDDMGGMDMGH
ncbi:MAG TPA: copper chaperone PCu(A)C [Stellaceae bacterium]|nr:copper chaperone PCu(A)C [Stellaceae bacterium]